MRIGETETSGMIASVLRMRRTVHEFQAEVPPRERLIEAIDIARWSPNHHRTEPWHFYLLDRDTAARVAALNTELVRADKGDRAAAVKQKRWLSMPGWLVITCAINSDQIREREDYAACCCAAHSVALYLWSHGIGMKWTTGAVTRERQFFDCIGMDWDAETAVGLFWYGYPATIPDQRRKPVTDIVTALGD